MEHRTIHELELTVGAQFRELRKRAGMTQKQLARDAGVSVVTIRSLETGAGSSLSTVSAVLRALDRSDWLDELAPSVRVSPMALLAEANATRR